LIFFSRKIYPNLVGNVIVLKPGSARPADQGLEPGWVEEKIGE
jgi:hypothetical protein